MSTCGCPILVIQNWQPSVSYRNLKNSVVFKFPRNMFVLWDDVWIGQPNIRSIYGQLISHKNVRLRCDWCFQQLISKDTYPNVFYVDESTVEMCSSGRLVFHQHGSNLDRLPAKSPKPKHSYKVNVWGGISYRGPTDICVFTGIMDSEIYQNILEDNLLPFTSVKFPDGFRLYQVCILVWINCVLSI